MNNYIWQVPLAYFLGYLFTYLFFTIFEDLDEYKNVQEFKRHAVGFSMVWPIMLPIMLLVFSAGRIKLGDIDKIRKAFGQSTFKDREK